MNPDPHEPSHAYLKSVRITDVLRVEHILLRTMMAQVSDWLAASMSLETMRERVALVERRARDSRPARREAIVRHASAPLRRSASPGGHDGGRPRRGARLFEEIEAGAEPIERCGRSSILQRLTFVEKTKKYSRWLRS